MFLLSYTVAPHQKFFFLLLLLLTELTCHIQSSARPRLLVSFYDVRQVRVADASPFKRRRKVRAELAACRFMVITLSRLLRPGDQ